jgi:hypothetical protein
LRLTYNILISYRKNTNIHLLLDIFGETQSFLPKKIDDGSNQVFQDRIANRFCLIEHSFPEHVLCNLSMLNRYNFQSIRSFDQHHHVKCAYTQKEKA